MTISPPFLQKGDKIAIAATARKISKEEINDAIAILSSWGLEVIFNEDIFSIQNQFAGDDQIRITNFQNYLNDLSIKAILCARGGYGTVRIIDKLDFSIFQKSPKWIIGFSDITVLHSHIHRHFHIQTIHSVMAFNFQKEKFDEESILSLKKILFGENISYQIPTHKLNKTGEAKAHLVGGNLSVLYSTIGSASDMDTSGKILFLEDLDEYIYHIDRMMMNLKRNRKLENLAGIVVGYMSDMKDNTIPFGKTAEEIISEHVQSFNFPVCFGFPAGHEKRNLALKFGAEVMLKVEKNKSELSF